MNGHEIHAMLTDAVCMPWQHRLICEAAMDHQTPRGRVAAAMALIWVGVMDRAREKRKDRRS